GTKIALQKLAARGDVHDIERVGEKLEVGVLHGQTRGRRGSGTGHGRVFLQSASPRGGWGKHIWMTDPKREQIKCQSWPCVQPASTERRCEGDGGILLQNDKISEFEKDIFSGNWKSRASRYSWGKADHWLGIVNYSRGRRNSNPKRRSSPKRPNRRTLATIGGVSLGMRLEEAG